MDYVIFWFKLLNTLEMFIISPDGIVAGSVGIPVVLAAVRIGVLASVGAVGIVMFSAKHCT